MKVFGIYGSPRRKGNSDVLLDKALEGAESAGAEITKLYARDLKMSGCIECGGCDKTGKCVVKDDMQGVYPMLESADAIILSAPIFFYGVPSQAKAVIDRGQACWRKRMITKTKEQRKTYDSGKGYLIAVGATSGKTLFDGTILTAKYFYDALDMSYEGELLVRKVDKKGAILEHPEFLKEAYDMGINIVNGKFAEIQKSK
ncbi:MAG: flavodoxin family protein [Candidatus Poribacteria bacterium]